MRVLLVGLIVATITMAGCFGGASKKDMEADVAEAIQDFRTAIGPQGDLVHIQVSGTVTAESEVNGFPVRVTLNPTMDVTFGDKADLLITGKALKLTFTAYCDPERMIAITQGGADYDIPDTSSEARNPIGYCSGPGSEAILLDYFEFELIDPALLTGDLDLDAMVPISFEEVGKAVAGTYEVEGPEGTTTLTITEKKGKIAQIVSENEDSHLTLDMTYGDRATLEVPVADRRLPSAVTGDIKTDAAGWEWTGTSRVGGPYTDYELHVYAPGASVGCGGSSQSPEVIFRLKDGIDQSKQGWRMVLGEDGDRKLGRGDQIILRQPGIQNDFDHVVVIHDAWADQTAAYSCEIPSIPAWSLLGLLGGLVAWRRR